MIQLEFEFMKAERPRVVVTNMEAFARLTEDDKRRVYYAQHVAKDPIRYLTCCAWLRSVVAVER